MARAQASRQLHLDPRVYVLVDPSRCRGRAPEAVAEAAARGGATLIQLRAKQASTVELLCVAERLRAVLGRLEVPLLINDRVDVALAMGAAGVHLGQQDLPVEGARRLLGGKAVIGLTVRTPAEAEAAPVDLVDYLAIGGVFRTASKANPRPPIGIAGLRDLAARLRARTDRPLVAISGITADNAGEVVAAGADGVAVIGAVCGAEDVEAAARALRRAVDAALARRETA